MRFNHRPFDSLDAYLYRIYNKATVCRKELDFVDNLEKLYLRLQGLVIFRNLLDDPLLRLLVKLLAGKEGSPEKQVGRYAAFVSALFDETDDLTAYIRARVLADDNIYVRRRAQGEPIADVLEECLQKELDALESLSQLTAKEIRASLPYDGYLPQWTNSPADFVSAYRDRMEGIADTGYGVFAKHHMFTVKDGAIVPAHWPDPVRLSDLIGYEAERQAVIDNTMALVAGRPAANTLLYGDAGTGKSSTVKAIVNEYRDRGLRLIEISKKQFREIPAIIESLSGNPLKFILFIDDLTFAEENDDFNALKAVLEGSVSHKSPNLVIYATSNRRHLIRETFSDRAGDDVHRNETIQELISLSERFGLSVSFYGPDKKLYHQIVVGLKAQYGIDVEDALLLQEADKYAFQRGGRSPRVARQFMEYLVSREG